MKSKSIKLNEYFLIFIFSLLFLGLIFRIVHLQIFKREFLQKFALKQHYKLIPIKGERGRIFDTRGRLLATDISVFSVYADPRSIENKVRAVKLLADILGLNEKELLDKFNKERDFVWVKRKITLDIKKRIESLHIKGIGFIEDKMRFYPQGELLSHVLGGVNIDNDGIEGLELFYDTELKGKDFSLLVRRDSVSNEIILSPQDLQSQRGKDIFLTIDAQIQYWVESYLAQTVKEYSAKGGSVIVMQPFTGEILALGNYPTYDPNYISSTPLELRRNLAITDFFEPGSVFKVVTLMASLDKGFFSLNDKIFCENGKYKIPGSILHDWKPYGHLSFKDVFKKSSNIGVAKIANALGKEYFYNYIRKLCFGEKTGVDLPGESSGMVKDLKNWSKTSPYIIPMGQEIGVTVLQLARLIASVVNGGYIVKPHVVKRIVGDKGFTKEIQLESEEIVSSKITNRAKEILVEVVEEGTGKLAKIDGLTVGGKTGTAQKFDFQLGRYSEDAHRASFVGFVEKDSLCFVICVTIDEPQNVHLGGVVAAPLFKKIAQNLIDYQNAVVKEVVSLPLQ
ncbi:MAG: penicillin-binding protein 2 [Candidatus Omnitrophica bacterium]|nr:penicillin-binding protein 2 [Candidatus Omnitrophota bacterium]MCM8826619.1 penicillin-binding protein 2 [Candidatus Omnitrophota bacterium]